MHSSGSSDRDAHGVVIRPATRADLETFYDGHIPMSMRAHVMLVDGKILGVGGLYDDQGSTVAFSQMRDELRAHKRLIAKGVRYLQQVLDSEPGVVLAVASLNEANSENLLEKIGFERVRNTPFGWLFRREAWSH